jgi:hypothetical protein
MGWGGGGGGVGGVAVKNPDGPSQVKVTVGTSFQVVPVQSAWLVWRLAARLCWSNSSRVVFSSTGVVGGTKAVHQKEPKA